ncbi:hypothetical protein A33Q_3877 [Indibacter alkaliphilus LW1]|uniref:Uncharacterized protein n=1 Tax=Indibacter alkaliphilus (strain CCUG 57479 / KCTC 22604 / LW1) TaxID=1189612 RepID=S2D1Q7_INDAL|nr:hypothetical protein A33Q_3877 [Indibacter alkaliphilus LW1]
MIGIYGNRKRFLRNRKVRSGIVDRVIVPCIETALIDRVVSYTLSSCSAECTCQDAFIVTVCKTSRLISEGRVSIAIHLALIGICGNRKRFLRDRKVSSGIVNRVVVPCIQAALIDRVVSYILSGCSFQCAGKNAFIVSVFKAGRLISEGRVRISISLALIRICGNRKLFWSNGKISSFIVDLVVIRRESPPGSIGNHNSI